MEPANLQSFVQAILVLVLLRLSNVLSAPTTVPTTDPVLLMVNANAMTHTLAQIALKFTANSSPTLADLAMQLLSVGGVVTLHPAVRCPLEIARNGCLLVAHVPTLVKMEAHVNVEPAHVFLDSLGTIAVGSLTALEPLFNKELEQ